MSRVVWNLLGIVTVVLLIAAPLGFAWHVQKDLRNLRVVREGVLYRSGQLSLDGIKRVIHDYGIRTVVSLRETDNPDLPQPDAAEEEYCRAEEVKFVRIAPKRWWAPDGPPPATVGVCKFCDIMADPENLPVLVHCFAGVHRSGAYCAVYRMEFEHWDNARAIAEVKACGYTNLDEEWDILGYLEQYTPSWKQKTEEPSPQVHKVKKVKTRGKRKTTTSSKTGE